MDQANKTQQRERYEKPELREYGDLRRLTETDAAGTASKDGGMYFGQDTKTTG